MPKRKVTDAPLAMLRNFPDAMSSIRGGA
ncbi:hypothetical protein CO2235_MP20298 [Cupriavidus oxalaticus]|uniref:Uncharacterized protein n=1 Tax=Cupriavidus oxalaticus TaxID=96344 RepID=A0A375GKZ3_9BURK|nr:hypothetical protein CO2235_MP20298 [Cupriavidus oxalaticus]